MAFVALSWFYSCNSPTENEKNIHMSARQISGCIRNVSEVRQPECGDKYFKYSFGDTLKIDFSVWGNCCPDSQRFAVNYKMEPGTIKVEVKDTAKLGCYCNCNYIIHMDFTGLTKDKYLFYLNYPGLQGDIIKYREVIER